jgi:hypothetical protein
VAVLVVFAVAAGGLVGAVVDRSVSPSPAPACRYRAGGALPDPGCTPGALNPAVTPATIHRTICVRGWTRKVRPPASVTGVEKRISMADYGVTGPAGFEYDHLVPLELGGAPNDSRNLWPERRAGVDGAGAKDKVENLLRAHVCAGRMRLRVAQRLIASDWRRGRP